MTKKWSSWPFRGRQVTDTRTFRTVRLGTASTRCEHVAVRGYNGILQRPGLRSRMVGSILHPLDQMDIKSQRQVAMGSVALRFAQLSWLERVAV